MKLIIASDIHGSALYCERLLRAFADTNADKLVLLGDLLYHGARNALPDEYNMIQVFEQLNAVSEHIVAVRGNCDSEVDQLVLDFPLGADYTQLYVDKRLFFITHGHLYSESDPPRLPTGSILCTGHTHIAACHEHDRFVYINPGSVSLPKGGTPRSYVLYDDGCFSWYDLDSKECWKRYRLDDGKTAW